MRYIDGFLVPVPEANKQAYLDSAATAWPIFRSYGAIEHVECWGSDLPEGKHTDFHKSVGREEGETVVFSWVIWPSKEVRDTAWAKMMADDAMKDMAMPFDGKRMIYGGFDMVFQQRA